MKPIYLDYAATTPVDPAVLKAMWPYFGPWPQSAKSKSQSIGSSAVRFAPGALPTFGNPGSLHSFGQQASAAVFKSRQAIAAALGCHYSEIIFTSGATEANNLALRGTMRTFWWNHFKENKKETKASPQILICAAEHESIIETAADIERRGAATVKHIPVNKQGIVDLKELEASLNENVVLVSVMYANNETGTIQPINKISKIIQKFRQSRHPERSEGSKKILRVAQNDNPNSSPYPLLHTDAVQAFQYLNCNVDDLGVDLLTLSAHKIYGPKGVGALYVRSSISSGKRTYPISPWQTGGGQEQSLRSGTENVPGIVGFAKAVELVEQARAKEAKRIAGLTSYLWEGIKKAIPDAHLNGSNLVSSFKFPVSLSRLPNNLNFYSPKLNGQELLVKLDLAGIAVSSGSACAARSTNPSHVLLAMGFNKERAKHSLRISLGRPTTKKEINAALRVIKAAAH